MVVSFRLRLRDTVRCTASTVHGGASHTARITSLSSSVRGARTRAPDAARIVMVHVVPENVAAVKKCLGVETGHSTRRRGGAENASNVCVRRYPRLGASPGKLN